MFFLKKNCFFDHFFLIMQNVIHVLSHVIQEFLWKKMRLIVEDIHSKKE